MTDPLDPIDIKQYVGRYRIMAPIGVGSSATVYRGLDETTDTEVAVKVLADNYSLVPDIRQRFLEEISLLMSIRSPAVAQVLGQGETDTGQPYIVLELADQGTLGQRVDELRRNEAAPNRQDLVAMSDHLAEALSSLHRAGIVHRDVSPGNILISAESGPISELSPLPSVRAGEVLKPDERYLLADLGFAKDLHHASGLTAGGGTRGFAAPEQRDEITVVDHRADIFGASSVIEWMAEGTDLVDDIEAFLDIGLAADPEDRYQTMEDWLKGLQRCLDRRPAAFPAPISIVEPEKQKEVGAGRTKTLLAVVGIGSVAAVGAWLLLIRPGSQTDALGSESAGVTSADRSDASLAADPESPTIETTAASSAIPTTTAPTDTSSTVDGESTAGQTDSVPTTGLSTTEPPTTGLPTTAAATTAVPSTTVPTSSGPTTTVTTQATTSTTIDPLFEFSPRAYIQSPAAESQISGDLRIRGTANYQDGITGVALIVRRMADDFVWTPATQSFESEWAQIPVGVTPSGGDDVTWSYTVNDTFLEPGRYLIRVWARGTDKNDPISDRREVVIPD